MNTVSQFLKKVSILLRRRQYSTELDEEMAFHREQVERDLLDRGMTSEAARYAAMRQFGNTVRTKERSHEMVGFRVETVFQDLKYSLRQLRKNSRLRGDRDPDSCARNRRQRSHLRVCRCRVDQAASLSGPDTADVGG